jgi:hypothetical protein
MLKFPTESSFLLQKVCFQHENSKWILQVKFLNPGAEFWKVCEWNEKPSKEEVIKIIEAIRLSILAFNQSIQYNPHQFSLTTFSKELGKNSL